MADRVTLELTPDEALVLFEWVRRTNATNNAGVQDRAEQRALWNLEATLEAVLVGPLDANYVGLVMAARDRLRDP